KDGRAIHVNRLPSTKAGGHGVASAMMDDLYAHANRQGAWIDHGYRKGPGLAWWNSYSEPHPELSTHNVHPDEPMQPSQLHPGGASWSHHFSPYDVASDMDRNSWNDQAGKHPVPHFTPDSYPDDRHNEKWRRARPYPRSWDGPSDDELDRKAQQYGFSTASLQAEAAYSDDEWAHHLREQHGYGDQPITHMFYEHGRLDDPHQAMHDAGLADHDHLEPHRSPLSDAAIQEGAAAFGKPPLHVRDIAPGWSDPRRGGAAGPGGLPETKDTVLRPATHPRFFSSLQTEAANRRRADDVYGQLAKNFPHDAISWVHGDGVRWHGPYDADPSEIDWDGRDGWAAYNQPQKVEKSAKKAQKKRDKGEDPKPAIGTQGPGQNQVRIQDGHHGALGALVSDQPLNSYVAEVPERQGPWDEMHSKQFTGGDTGKQLGPDGTDEERADFQDHVESKVSRIEADRDSLDHGEPADPQEQEAVPPKGKKGGGRPPVVPRQRHDSPSAWPLATAPVQDGYPALSEGTHSQP